MQAGASACRTRGTGWALSGQWAGRQAQYGSGRARASARNSLGLDDFRRLRALDLAAALIRQYLLVELHRRCGGLALLQCLQRGAEGEIDLECLRAPPGLRQRFHQAPAEWIRQCLALERPAADL